MFWRQVFEWDTLSNFSCCDILSRKSDVISLRSSVNRCHV